jgi:hypothetical protein
MIILKSKSYRSPDDLVMFININKIRREDILTVASHGPTAEYTVFFYADSEGEEISRGFFGWDK